MRVVASLTTIPGRYEKLQRTLDSIWDQNVKPDVIYLGIPKVSKRLGTPYPELPNTITSRCQIISLDQDYGPICKIVGALLSESDPETIIITFDDDIVYPKTLIEELVKYSSQHPNSAIGSTGIIVGQTFFNYSFVSGLTPCWNGLTGFKVTPEGRAVDLLCGVAGVLYRRKFFPDDITPMLEYTSKYPDLFMNDDVLISAYLNSRKVERRLFLNIPFAQQELDTQDVNAISFSRIQFLQRFHSAVNICRSIGLLEETVPTDTSEGLVIRVGFFLFIFIIFLLLVIYLIVSKN
jgi:hypothetical protein